MRHSKSFPREEDWHDLHGTLSGLPRGQLLHLLLSRSWEWGLLSTHQAHHTELIFRRNIAADEVPRDQV